MALPISEYNVPMGVRNNPMAKPYQQRNENITKGNKTIFQSGNTPK
jgi:hypothetical protein